MMTTTSSDQHSDKDLDFYIKECAKIVKVDGSGVDDIGSSTSTDILYEIGCQIAAFKSIETIK